MSISPANASLSTMAAPHGVPYGSARLALRSLATKSSSP